MRPTRAAAAALAVLTLAACARHQERELTGWLKVDIVRPVTGTSGTIVLGRNEEVFHVKVGSQWTVLGSGHPSRYIVLNDPNKEYHEKDSQPAALVDLNDGKGVQIVRAGAGALQPLSQVFGRTGEISVPPSRTAIDVADCRGPAAPAGCRDLRIDRYDPRGSLVKSFHILLPEAHPDCQLVGIRWYDSVETPIVDARCAAGSQGARCLWLMPRDGGLVVRAVGKDRPHAECSDASGLGVARSDRARFEVLH